MCQGIDGIMDTSASTSIGLIKAALDEEAMNCAIYEEGYHTEVETVAEEEIAADVVIEEEIKVEPAEVTVPDPVEEEDEFDDYDDDEDDDSGKRGGFGLGTQLKIWWGKAQKKMEDMADETDKMIGNIAN